MTDKKDSLDGYLPWLIGFGSLAGGLIIGYGVIPQVLKLINPPPPPPPPKTEEKPPEPQPEPEFRLRPKYLHSSAKVGEQIGNPTRPPVRSYRNQMSQQQTVKKKSRWRVIE